MRQTSPATPTLRVDPPPVAADPVFLARLCEESARASAARADFSSRRRLWRTVGMTTIATVTVVIGSTVPAALLVKPSNPSEPAPQVPTPFTITSSPGPTAPTPSQSGPRSEVEPGSDDGPGGIPDRVDPPDGNAAPIAPGSAHEDIDGESLGPQTGQTGHSGSGQPLSDADASTGRDPEPGRDGEPDSNLDGSSRDDEPPGRPDVTHQEADVQPDDVANDGRGGRRSDGDQDDGHSTSRSTPLEPSGGRLAGDRAR